MDQGQGYGGPTDEQPFLMPAGMPPGAEYIHDERTPEGVTYFRIYAGLMSVSSAGLAIMGLVMMASPLFASRMKPGEDITAFGAGLFYGIMGMIFFIPWVLALFGPRRPWVHTVGLVMVGLSMLSCCVPLAIPVLITWTKPETKRWYGA